MFTFPVCLIGTRIKYRGADGSMHPEGAPCLLPCFGATLYPVCRKTITLERSRIGRVFCRRDYPFFVHAYNVVPSGNE